MPIVKKLLNWLAALKNCRIVFFKFINIIGKIGRGPNDSSPIKSLFIFVETLVSYEYVICVVLATLRYRLLVNKYILIYKY